ncbi:hypothetical protein HN51_005678 [Arachis hypogaea]|uniref:C2 domain-containing protein n=1 Tax=Arachis hypogaea TaxID=3818 RepID=A0A445DDN2_ARAHY|nr:BON1-associated protein 2 [Arachis hypogaea]QHO39469.1 BON1-associated protein [Arachis hypogaea]RYR61291.1 hypothetical protein Ahy_A04g018445 [Arachis hypogaea]
MDARCPVRTLELTVQSVEGLRLDRKPATTKNNLFVVVRAESINSYTTCMAKEDDTNNNLTWNHKLDVDVPLHASSITLEVKSKTLKGVKDVGIARVAVSEFMGGFGSVPQHCLQFLSYRLRDWEGRRNGVLNFSVRVVNSPEYATAAVGKAVSPCGFKLRGTTMGATTSSSSCGGGVVVGVPIGWNSYGSSTYNNV